MYKILEIHNKLFNKINIIIIMIIKINFMQDFKIIIMEKINIIMHKIGFNQVILIIYNFKIRINNIMIKLIITKFKKIKVVKKEKNQENRIINKKIMIFKMIKIMNK